MTTKKSLMGALFHFDVEERKAYAEKQRKGMENKNTHFCSVFFPLKMNFKRTLRFAHLEFIICVIFLQFLSNNIVGKVWGTERA